MGSDRTVSPRTSLRLPSHLLLTPPLCWFIAGWVTDMAPGGVGIVASRHATHIAPPLDEEDGAARVLDPVFSHVIDPTWLVRGQFFRNYFIAGW